MVPPARGGGADGDGRRAAARAGGKGNRVGGPARGRPGCGRGPGPGVVVAGPAAGPGDRARSVVRLTGRRTGPGEPAARRASSRLDLHLVADDVHLEAADALARRRAKILPGGQV